MKRGNMDYKQIIIVRKDLKMGTGKIAAQCAHAAIAAFEKTMQQKPQWVDAWKEQGQEKVVLKVQTKKELLDWFEKLKTKFPTALIKDAGRTQIAPGEPTCIGVGPAPEIELDKYTKELKLL